MSIYEVAVTREDGYWVAVAAGVRGGATEVRRLDHLDGEVRDLLSGLLDVDPSDLKLNYAYAPAIGRKADVAVNEYREAAVSFDLAKMRYEVAQHYALQQLREAGLSLRDTAFLTNISFQRVQQVLGRRANAE
jgi:hypothetical protein